MSSIVMNIDGWEMAHEAHMLEEYSEEVKRAEWDARSAPVNEDPARLNDRRDGTTLALALSSEEEETEVFPPIPSTAFPQCP